MNGSCIWETVGVDLLSAVGLQASSAGQEQGISMYLSTTFPWAIRAITTGSWVELNRAGSVEQTRSLIESVRPAGGHSSLAFALSHHSCVCDLLPHATFYFQPTNSMGCKQFSGMEPCGKPRLRKTGQQKYNGLRWESQTKTSSDIWITIAK